MISSSSFGRWKSPSAPFIQLHQSIKIKPSPWVWTSPFTSYYLETKNMDFNLLEPSYYYFHHWPKPGIELWRRQEPWNVEDLSEPPDQHGGKAAPAEFVTHLVGYDATGKTETEAAKPYFHLTISLKLPGKDLKQWTPYHSDTLVILKCLEEKTIIWDVNIR